MAVTSGNAGSISIGASGLTLNDWTMDYQLKALEYPEFGVTHIHKISGIITGISGTAKGVVSATYSPPSTTAALTLFDGVQTFSGTVIITGHKRSVKADGLCEVELNWTATETVA